MNRPDLAIATVLCLAACPASVRANEKAFLHMKEAEWLEGGSGGEAVEPEVTGFTLTFGDIDDVAAVADALPGVLEGSANTSQALIGNRIEEEGIGRRTIIQDSFLDNEGILNVNQNSGDIVNQANVRVLATVGGHPQFVHLDLWGEARLLENSLSSTSTLERENRIAGSFGGTTGVVGVNQSAGNLNQELNVLVLGLGSAPSPDFESIGDSALGQVSAENELTVDTPGPRSEIITDSFTGFHGFAQVNQSSGDLNILRNFLGVSLSVVNKP